MPDRESVEIIDEKLQKEGWASKFVRKPEHAAAQKVQISERLL